MTPLPARLRGSFTRGPLTCRRTRPAQLPPHQPVRTPQKAHLQPSFGGKHELPLTPLPTLVPLRVLAGQDAAPFGSTLRPPRQLRARPRALRRPSRAAPRYSNLPPRRRRHRRPRAASCPQLGPRRPPVAEYPAGRQKGSGTSGSRGSLSGPCAGAPHAPRSPASAAAAAAAAVASSAAAGPVLAR